MSNRIELAGERFGKLVVVSYVGKDKNGKALWNCKCDCGKETIKSSSLLRNEMTKSCGCLRKEMIAIANKGKETHGKSKSHLYGIWHGMKERICCKTYKQYKDYGGRGIGICEEWRENFESFEKWALQNGYRKGLEIDRIDNEKGYYPQNCRWTIKKVQANNRRSNRIIEYQGKKRTMKEWAEITRINYATLKYRLSKGWSIEKALETPVKRRKR